MYSCPSAIHCTLTQTIKNQLSSLRTQRDIAKRELVKITEPSTSPKRQKAQEEYDNLDHQYQTLRADLLRRVQYIDERKNYDLLYEVCNLFEEMVRRFFFYVLINLLIAVYVPCRYIL